MFRVSREIDFCYGHRLLHYQGKCRHLHGHNGKVMITFEAGALDDRGMVLDFGDIKRVVSVPAGWQSHGREHRPANLRFRRPAGFSRGRGPALGNARLLFRILPGASAG